MRYSGRLGLAEQKEILPGRWDNVITEREVTGKVENKVDTQIVGSDILPGMRTTTSVSILGFGPESDYSKIAYVSYRGKNWNPASVVENYPEITIYLGEEYNGPLPV